MRALLLTGLLALGPWTALAQEEPAPEDWQIERREWTWQVDDRQTIRVHNPAGNLAVRAHDRDEVYLLANTQRHRDDPRSFEVGVVDEAAAFEVVVGFQEGDGVDAPAAWGRRRADLTVFVPGDRATVFSTHKGTLEIRGSRGSVRATSFSGDLRLRVYGAVDATSDHGDVLAQFLRTDWPEPSEISTASGSIRVEMPRGGSAEVEIETRGEITSDYSMQVEREQGTQLKRARISAGVDGPRLKLTSHQGPIQFVEILVPEETDEEPNDDP